ncbi:MAG TPA: PEP/pyruvate-binding domain-containing protein, partial [bacterium]|nr:PEP/pyruvate-binding domain-containing protein [bacterium]
AIALRGLTIAEFPDGAVGIRRMLAEILAAKRGERTRESMANYSETLLAERFFFMRLASGSVGGKGRGLSFIEHVLHRAGLDAAVPGLNIRLPRTAIIGTDEFHLFVDGIGQQRILQMNDEGAVRSLFLRTPLTLTLRQRLRVLLGKVTGPLAVRSSGLFEDSLSQPFAGIYETYFLPNSHPDPEVRLRQLEEAIRLVFASVYSPLARSYFDSVQYEMEEEKMAVIIQELVGRRRGDRFYPHISGVAQSYNYYPFAKMKPEDGIALLAVGLGKAVVDGEQVFRFCPRYPKARNQSLKDMLNASQRYFYALDMRKSDADLLEGEMATLVRPEVIEAEQDGMLDMCVSTYDGAQNLKKPGLHAAGPRIVDFSYILEYKQVPLAGAIQTTLDIMKHALGTPVEIEFAVDLDEADNGAPTLYLLQVKPLVRNTADHHIDPATLDRSNLFLYTTRGMGNGIVEDVRDIVYISPDRFDRLKTEAMAVEIAAINKVLKAENRRYILIGPGRWGSSDRFLGVPVDWSAISQTRVIVEAGLSDFSIDASLGSHFFHNITSMNIGYFTVAAHSEEDLIDWKWLAAQPLVAEKQYARHVRLERPVLVRMDGRSGIAAIGKPPLH